MNWETSKPWNIFENPLWRCIVVENYAEDTSYVVFIFNHCFADGINIAALLKFLSDDSETSQALTNRGSLANSSIQLFLSPFIRIISAAHTALYLLTLGNAENALKK